MVEISEFSRDAKDIVIETRDGKVRLSFKEWKQIADAYKGLLVEPQ